MELDTGKALNIAPPGHEKYFDPLRDYFNYSKGWSRPDDPTLQHDTQTPDHAHFQDAAAVRAGLKGKSVNDIREVVGSLIEQRIYFDFIKDRTDVLDAVSELGKVTRISDKFISLKLDGADKAIRLKGAFMSQNLVSNLTLRIEQEKQVMQEHQEKIGLFRRTQKLAEQLEKDLQSLQEDVQNTTKDATNLLNEAKQSLNSAQTASQSLAELLQQQTEGTANLLSQQAEQLEQLKAQSAQLNSMSQGIAETAKIKKTLFTSNIV